MRKLIYTTTLLLSALFYTSCEKNDDTPIITNIDYVGFENGFTIEVEPSETQTKEVKIATSTKTTGNRTFFLVVDTDLTTADASAYTLPSSVTVLANTNLASFNIEVIGENIDPSGDDELVINLISPQDDTYISGPITLKLKQLCLGSQLFLNITFDSWPEEVYWRILDSNDDIVFESLASNGIDPEWGAYAGTEDSGINRALCLTSGNYTFEIYDAFDDGAGPFELSLDGVELFSSDGAYGTFVSTTFSIP